MVSDVCPPFPGGTVMSFTRSKNGRSSWSARRRGASDWLFMVAPSFSSKWRCSRVSLRGTSTVTITYRSPRPRPVTLGIPYVAFDVPPGSAEGIARFYREIMGAPAWTAGAGAAARVLVAKSQHLVFRETDRPQPPFDGHHVQIALADFGGPYARLRELCECPEHAGSLDR